MSPVETRSANYRRAFPLAAAGVFVLVMGIVVLAGGVPEPAVQEKNVLFSLDDQDARSVAVVGTFNNWSRTAHPLTRRNGLWQITIPLKKGATYFYNFLVDGEKWITDPSRLDVSEDDFGKKSVLELYDEGEP